MPTRPPSPSPSTVSVRSTASVKSSTAGGKKKKETPSYYDECPIEEIQEYASKPHRSWDSALKEMARLEAIAERARRERESDTCSNASTVSAYSVASVRSTMSLRSNASNVSVNSNASAQRKRAAGGFVMSTPLKAQTLRSSSQHGQSSTTRKPRPSSSASSGIENNDPNGSGLSLAGSGMSSGLVVAGAAGGLSGIRGTASSRHPNSAPPASVKQTAKTPAFVFRPPTIPPKKAR